MSTAAFQVSRKRQPGTRARYKWHGLTHVHEMHAGRWRTWIVISGRRHMVMNESLPISTGRQYIAHPQDAECEACHYLYSHVMTEARSQCNECDLQDAAERARELEEQGVRLGWGFHERDDQLLESVRERAHKAGHIPTRSV